MEELAKGKRGNVRLVDSVAELEAFYREHARDGEPVGWSGYKGWAVRRPDGIVIGYRLDSSMGTPAVDVKIPGFTERFKVHVR